MRLVFVLSYCCVQSFAPSLLLVAQQRRRVKSWSLTSKDSAVVDSEVSFETSPADSLPPWRLKNEALLISSFSDGLLPNQQAHAFLKRGLVRALLTDAQQVLEAAVSDSVRYSPCAGPDMDTVTQLEAIDDALKRLQDYADDTPTNHQVDELLLLRLSSTFLSGRPLALRFVYIPTAMYALRSDSTSTPGKQRQRARADGKQRRNDIVKLLAELLAPLDIPIHVVTLDLDDGSVKQPEGCDKSVFPTTGKDALRDWNPHLVYIQGGNTFWLHHCCMATKGSWRDDFWDFCQRNAGVLIGSSAGAILAGHSMETACWKEWDDPTVVPGMSKYEDWTGVQGLGLIGNRSVFPHMDDTWNAVVSEKSIALEIKPLCLRENDVCMIDGRNKTIQVVSTVSAELID
jgi:hypothetical protein